MNKKKQCIMIILFLMISIIFTGCISISNNNTYTDETVKKQTEVVSEIHEITEKGTIIILATGGTIAGIGEEGKETGYTSGSLNINSLIEAVPGIDKIANIEAIQVCNINSDDITSSIWIELAKKINELSKNENVTGFVITHGTDTMEETAYFLNMVIKTDKPVVLTGAMRPTTAISADGPMNLYHAVCVAVSNESVGKGVLVVFSNRIYSARSVKKVSTYNVMSISAGESGNIGVIRNSEVVYYEEPTKKHTTETEFNVENVDVLPNVQIVYFAVDADPNLLKYAAAHSDGLVIAGAGAGEFSKKFIETINELKIPIIISSRVNDGLITQDSVLCKNTVAANNLPPQKAAILLRLALMNKTTTQDDLIRIFKTYWYIIKSRKFKTCLRFSASVDEASKNNDIRLGKDLKNFVKFLKLKNKLN